VASIEFDIHSAVSPKARIRKDHLTDAGVVLTTATVLFTARVVCERTLLAWTRGVYVGSDSPLLHFAMDFIGVLGILLAILWGLIVAVLSLLNKSRISATDRWLIAVIAVCSGLWLVPHEEWKLLTVRYHGAAHVPKNWVVSAAASGEMRLLDYLLAHGVDVNTRAQYGESPLGAAAAAGQTDAARFLIARGARLNNRTAISLETPLTEAAQMNHMDIVQLLMDHGADASARDAMDRTALDWARTNENPEMIRFLQARLEK
jgi:hypothetical protein